MKIFKRYFQLFTIVLIIVSCSKDNDPQPIVEKPVLVQATLLDSRTASELQFLVQLSGRDLDPAFFKYDVKIYKITYTTTYKNDKVTASGLIALPVTEDAVGMFSLQHGTILQYGEAPSVKQPDSFDVVLYEAAASKQLKRILPSYRPEIQPILLPACARQ
jgi:hypothetical protein